MFIKGEKIPKGKKSKGPVVNKTMQPKVKAKGGIKGRPKDNTKNNPKGTPNDKPKVNQKGLPRGDPKGPPKDFKLKDIAKDAPKEIPKKVQRDEPKNNPKGTPKNVPKVAPNDIPNDIPKDIPKENPKDIPKENPKKNSKDNPKDNPKNNPKVPPPPLLPPFTPKKEPEPALPPATFASPTTTSIVVQTTINPNLSAQSTIIPEKPTVTIESDNLQEDGNTMSSAGIIFGIMVAFVIVVGVIAMFIRKKLPELRKNKSSGGRSVQRNTPTNENNDLNRSLNVNNTSNYQEDSGTFIGEPRGNNTTGISIDNYNTSRQIPMMSRPQNPPQVYSNPINYYQPRPSPYPPGHDYVYKDPAISTPYQRNPSSTPPVNEVYYNRLVVPTAPPNRSNYSKYDRMMNKPLPSVP